MHSTCLYSFVMIMIVGAGSVTACTTIQTCKGCRIAANCNLMDNMTTTTTDDCQVLLTGAATGVLYNRTTNNCSSYNCSASSLLPGHRHSVVYRKSCNTECPEYEVFYLSHYQGTGAVLTSGSCYMASGLEACADMTGCIGVTYDPANGTCTYHSSVSHVLASGYYFMEKRCSLAAGDAGCTITTQKCHFCHTKTLSTFCQDPMFDPSYHHSLDSCTTEMAAYTQLGRTLVYEPTTGRCLMYDCHFIRPAGAVQQTISTRMSCTSDCPEYKLFAWDKNRGSSDVIAEDQGNVTYDGCISRCLDMTGCRGISYHKQVNWHCLYHNDSTKGFHVNYTFVARACFSPSITPIKDQVQQCTNCRSPCQYPVNTVSTIGSQQTGACDITNANCSSAFLNPVPQECYSFACDVTAAGSSNTRLLRKTSNTDCLKFKLHVKLGTTDCSTIGAVDHLVSYEECFRTCMDMALCRAITVDITLAQCTYHDCSEPAAVVPGGLYLIQKVCEDGCTNLTQTCTNCSPDPTCLPASAEAFDSATCAVFLFICSITGSCEMLHMVNNSSCGGYQCQLVAPQAGEIVYRKSCNNDCTVYEIHMSAGHVGTCSILFDEYFITTGGVCLSRCLDTPDCRGVTYTTFDGHCTYHSCDCMDGAISHPNTVANTFFYWKVCQNATIPPGTVNICHMTTTTTDSTTTEATTTAATSASPTPTPTTTTTVTMTSIAVAQTPTGTPANITVSPLYIVPCVCSTGTFDNFTVEEIVEFLIVELTLDSGNTSAARRKLECAADQRTSAATVGLVGSVILGTVGFCLVLLDMTRLIKVLKGEL